MAFLALAAALLAGCEPPKPRTDAEWRPLPMTNGPAVWTACVNGDRLYALQPLHSRGKDGLWPGASIAVAPRNGYNVLNGC